MASACKLVSIIFIASSVLSCAALKYDSSKIYSYSYQTDIHLHEISSKKATKIDHDVGLQLSVSFDLYTVYKDDNSQIFKLSVTKAQASSKSHPKIKKDLADTLSLPVLFQLNGDLVENLQFASKDSTFSRNVKKGIVALFQVQEKAGKRREVDVSGECEATYTYSAPDSIIRTKSDCKNLEIAKQFSNTNTALGTSVYTKSSQQYKLKDSVIENVFGTHQVTTYLNLRPALNGVATSSQNLQLESQHDGSPLASSLADAVAEVEKETVSKYTLTLLPSEEEIQQCTEGCLSPKAVADKLSEDLKAENIATVKSAKAFIQLLKSFRGSGKKSVAEVLTNPDSFHIVIYKSRIRGRQLSNLATAWIKCDLNNQKASSQLIDVATATQTESAKEALLELLDFEDLDAVEHPQRFLFAAAYLSHPSESFIADLLSILKKPIPNNKLHESLLLSSGAIVHTFCQVINQCNSPVIGEFKSLITSGLSECKEEECTLMYLRALGNAGLASTISVILPYTESPESPMVSSTAISAFRRINERFITSQVKEAMLRIYHQNKANYESSVRVAALELLLENQPSKGMIKNILLSCLDQSNAELSTYIMRMLLDAASSNPSLSSQLASVLQDTQINNYNVLSQKGKSSVITSYLAQMKDLNGTYSLYFENSQAGVMKRSGMVVSLQGKIIKQPLMKFGIYADGLESLVGDAAEEEMPESKKEDSSEDAPIIEPTAGMSFTFMNVLLTQVEFFRGMSGLLSAAWSAPSDLTSALQGSLLLQDHSQRIHLSNGLVLDTKVLGALSLDLSGYISISIWNRNCEALIRNSGALFLEGSLTVESKVLNIGLVFTGEGESSIDYTSNADFYEMPLKLCMQMKRPDFEFIQKVEKFEELTKGKRYKSRRSQKTKVFGEEYLLNKANSEECRVMLKEDQ